MPYPAGHEEGTRARILAAARALYNRRGALPPYRPAIGRGSRKPPGQGLVPKLFETMSGIFEANLEAEHTTSARQLSLAISSACVGAMVITRTMDDPKLADEICEAARQLVSSVLPDP